MTFIMAAIAFVLLNNNAWTWALLVALAGTVLNYLAGDLFVLPRYGNIVASIGEGVMAALVAYIVDVITPLFNTTFASLAIFGVLIAIGEYFFHQHLKNSEEVAP